MIALPRTSGSTEHNANAFDCLRMIAALAVLVSHSFILYGREEPRLLGGMTAGSLAVALFFAISGYLICQSWERDPNLKRFALRRALRIFPGLLVIVILTALLLGPVMSSLDAKSYFLTSSPWNYLWSAGLTLGSPRLAGVFETNPYPFAINGSLWTLRYEILMYVVLAVTCRMFVNNLRVMCSVAFILLGSAWIWISMSQFSSLSLPFVWRLGTEFYWDRITYLGAFFFAGACVYLYAAHIRLSRSAVLIGVLLVSFVDNKIAAMVMLWILIAYANVVFAFKAPRVLRYVNGFDYSYGIYIYAFPVQQCVSQIGKQAGWGWVQVLIVSLIVTLAAAAISWHVVEKPALTLKRFLRVRPAADIPMISSLSATEKQT